MPAFNFSCSRKFFEFFSHKSPASLLGAETGIFKTVTPQKPREIAFRVLRKRSELGNYVENLLDSELAGATISPRDRALCQELVYGVVRWQAALDWIAGQKTGPRPQKPAIQTLLRLGLYQIFFLDRVPDHAAVNETVEMARHCGCGTQTGFLNAVLRGCLRERDTLDARIKQLRKDQPWTGWSHPEWLWKRWSARWGAEKTARLMEWNNSPASACARVNTLKIQADKLVERWRMEENVEYDFLTRDWTGENLVFTLKSHPPLPKMQSFLDGWFYIQDPSTLMSVNLLDPKPGDSVLDFCAAPGGKTTFIAQLMNNQGRIVACDNAVDRIALLEENCRRLGVTCSQAFNLAAATATLGADRFDRVLVDAPCSNTGVMRRRVELRWRIQAVEIQRLRAAQLELLGRAAPLVKPGGVLVYSTCSLEPEENTQVTQEFLASRSDFQLETERELFPPTDGVDGAYAARMKRING
jgi:16S rRNA (cytosine967-C5)-methyltransferase